MAIDPEWIKVSFDSQHQHCMAQGNFSAGDTEGM